MKVVIVTPTSLYNTLNFFLKQKNKMKHAKAIFFILPIVSVVIFSSCNKSNTEISTAPASTADGFTWTENGGTTVKRGFMPFFFAQSHSLFV